MQRLTIHQKEKKIKRKAYTTGEVEMILRVKRTASDNKDTDLNMLQYEDQPETSIKEKMSSAVVYSHTG